MDDRRRRFEAQALPHLDAAYNLARWLSRSPADADDYKNVDGKFEKFFSDKPGEGD